MINIKSFFKESMKIPVEEYIFLSGSQKYQIPHFFPGFEESLVLASTAFQPYIALTFLKYFAESAHTVKGNSV